VLKIQFMKIGELASRTGCSIQTIRFYERESLINTPQRTQSNYRLYDKGALRQLTFIKQCRSLDMSIIEIKQLIQNKENPNNSCASINSMIDVHISDVTNRIQELIQLKETLSNMALACSSNRSIKNCGVLQKLTE
jgi:Cd(II)/Pb(II)-responsive transcriptional regulator